MLELTEHVDELRSGAAARIHGHERRLDRLRYWPEPAIDSDVGDRLGARVMASVSGDPPPPMHLDRLDAEGHTILYGTGGSGKGTLTAEWIRRLVADAGARVLIIDYENHPHEWARRLVGLGGADLADRILHVAPFTADWTGRSGAIWRQAPDLHELARAWEATYVVIDSIVPACGATDSLKPEAAGQYAAALERIGLPALSLAHVTKAEQLAYPFGSVFWHNLARTTWSLEADGRRSILTHRKHNNFAPLAKQHVEVTWYDGLPREVTERPYQEVLAARLARLLGERALKVKQIGAELNDELDEGEKTVSDDTIRRTLNRGRNEQPPLFEKAEGDLWRTV